MKVTFVTINTPCTDFAMSAFIFCFSKLWPILNFVVLYVKNWSYDGILSFSGFSFN